MNPISRSLFCIQSFRELYLLRILWHHTIQIFPLSEFRIKTVFFKLREQIHVDFVRRSWKLTWRGVPRFCLGYFLGNSSTRHDKEIPVFVAPNIVVKKLLGIGIDAGRHFLYQIKFAIIVNSVTGSFF